MKDKPKLSPAGQAAFNKACSHLEEMRADFMALTPDVRKLVMDSSMAKTLMSSQLTLEEYLQYVIFMRKELDIYVEAFTHCVKAQQHG